MSYSNIAKNGMLDWLRGQITELSIHTGNPGTTGATEVAGGGYARVAVTSADFDAAANGEVILNNDKEFDGPANEDALNAGAWGGTDFLISFTGSGDLSFNADGKLLLKAGTTFDLNA